MASEVITCFSKIIKIKTLNLVLTKDIRACAMNCSTAAYVLEILVI